MDYELHNIEAKNEKNQLKVHFKGCLPFDLLWSNKHKINEGPFIRREWALDKWTIWVQSYKQIYTNNLWL